jgi:hypothetical protein
MRLEDPKQVQTEKLSIWEEGKVMAWALKWPGLKAERIQYLEDIDSASCRYHCFDRFSGILSPVVMSFYREKMQLGFESVGNALKQKVESN